MSLLTLEYYVPAFVYSALQILSEAVSKTGGVDQQKLISYIRGNTFQTVVGNVTFGRMANGSSVCAPASGPSCCASQPMEQVKIIFR